MAKITKKFATLDGNEAAAYCAFAFTQVAAIYPITPSSAMAEHMDAWSAKDKVNMFGDNVKVMEMESEAGAAGALHGALQAGSLATTFTASQGLLLMVPNIYKWVGELLPAVLHVSARSIATRALSIFGDHQDIYAVRQSGIPMICSHSVQEVADLAPVAHLAAIKGSTPILHFFDGFRTSHEIQKVELLDYSVFEKLLDREALEKFRAHALNPHTNPVTRGGAENDDIYFQGREAQNLHYAQVVETVVGYMKKISKITGREYAPFTYYGHPKATKVIVAMGSVTETIKETVDDLNSKGEKVGLVKVHLYRPFSTKYLVKVLPTTVQKIAVLDRTKEMGSTGEPLYLDVVAAIREAELDIKVIVGGRYGLSSKDTQPNQIKAVFDHLSKRKPFNSFTIGINDDVTHLSLPVDEDYYIEHDYTSCLFYGLGSDGTVSANKNSIKIIGDHTDLYSQAYFAYDSKKAGGVTRSHLRFGKNPIHSTYYITNADFISCSLETYLIKYDMLRYLKKGGRFLLNTSFGADEIVDKLPNRVKKQLAVKKAKFYIIDATSIAHTIGMGRHTNTILQSAFFKLNPSIISFEEATTYMKAAAKKSYAKKGDEVVQLNYLAIDKGGEGIVEVPVNPEWANLEVKSVKHADEESYFDYYAKSINALEGYDLPVSTFTKNELLDGTMQNNATYREKRTIASEVPHWFSENCIQCGKCAFVCPHATIRAFVLNEQELEAAPQIVKDDVLPAMGPKVAGLKYRIQVTPTNCVGCGLCAVECPGKAGKKALVMMDVKTQMDQDPAADYLYNFAEYRGELFPLNTIKNAALNRPYHEISGSCAGCGETPYYRLVSQLFGKDMLVANATGCSSIYCGSTPSTPFVKDKDGKGIAWANSLFEDNAEFGYGMRLSLDYKLNLIRTIIERSIDKVEPELKDVLTKYLEVQRSREETEKLYPEIIRLVKESSCVEIKELLDYERDIINKSVWIIGGDGWAYDIGYGGLDHVLANRENVNILVLDTEVYSNTGGQASKSSRMGQVAKFAAAGKKVAKKDLGAIAMTYGHVYVAQVSMGANPTQVIRAMKEAESYDGPSIIIAYSPCVEHGIKAGMSNHQVTERKAAECGYFIPYRYDPRREAQGLNPLQIDITKEPDFNLYREFVLTENRYASLLALNPEEADELLLGGQEHARKTYERLKKLAQ
jgi:pyruvate-ferredoxin/flavodoxin oxidoreductase